MSRKRGEKKEIAEIIEQMTAEEVAKELTMKTNNNTGKKKPNMQKDLSKYEAECRKKIKLFIKTGHQYIDKKSDTEYIHNVYDEMASKVNEITGNNKNSLKHFMNNLIDYTASAPFSRWIEDNVKNDELDNALKRRKLLIDQLTRLNTKPNVDPFLERFISTFWPEADSIPYKRPTPNTIRKETIIKTTLYPTLPTIHLNPEDKNENTDGEKDNHTYGSKIMTLTEKVKGDQMDYDTLGVEMFLNTLLTTGSNLSFVPVDLKMEEEYKLEEILSNTANIPQDDDDE